MGAAESNPFAPPEETSSTHPPSTPDDKRSRRLRRIFSVHVSSVLLGYFVARYEAFFFSGGRVSEFLFMAAITAAFYVCPIATIATVRFASQYSVPRKLTIVAVDLVLSVLQIVALLPLVQ